jgi:hypothetical protein
MLGVDWRAGIFFNFNAMTEGIEYNIKNCDGTAQGGKATTMDCYR